MYYAVNSYICKRKLLLVTNFTYARYFKLRDDGNSAPEDGAQNWTKHPNPYISFWDAAAIGLAQPSNDTLRNALLMTDIAAAKLLYSP